MNTFLNNIANSDDKCEVISPEENKTLKVDNIIQFSKDYKGKYFFLFFLNRKDNFDTMKEFAQNVNLFFSDLLELKFYCSNITKIQEISVDAAEDHKFDSQLLYVIRDEEVIESKNFKHLSSEYLDYLLNKFNLTEHVEKKADDIMQKHQDLAGKVQAFIQKDMKHIKGFNDYSTFLEVKTDVHYIKEKYSKYKMNLLQTSLNVKAIQPWDKEYFVLVEQTSNRFMRLILALLLVTLSSFICFLCVKSSVDWATSSQTELNKLKMNQMEEVTKEVKGKFSYILNTDI